MRRPMLTALASEGWMASSATVRPSTAFEMIFCATTKTSPAAMASELCFDRFDDQAGNVIARDDLGQSSERENLNGFSRHVREPPQSR